MNGLFPVRLLACLPLTFVLVLSACDSSEPVTRCTGLTCAEGVCEALLGIPYCVENPLSDGSKPPLRLALPSQFVPLPATGAPVEDSVQVGRWFSEGVYFAIEAEAGHWYRVTASCPESESCSAFLADEAGVVFAEQHPNDTSMPRQRTSTFKAEQTGRRILALSLARDYTSSSERARYSVQLDPIPDDHGETAATATPVTGQDTAFSGTGELVGDHDVFTFTVQQGERFHVSCQAVSGVQSQLRTTLSGPAGQPDVDLTYSGPEPLQAKASGPHFLDVETVELPDGTRGKYRCHFRSLLFDEAGDTEEEAKPLVLPVHEEGWFEDDTDVDVYSVELSPDEYYVMDCTISASFCRIRVRFPSGAVLTTSSASLLDLSEAGVYFIEVSGPPLHRYGLRLERVGGDDHGDMPARATPVPANPGSVAGTFEYSGDVDAFAFDATAGHAHTFRCTLGADARPSNWELTLRGPDGAVATSASSAYGDPLLVAVTAPASARYTLEVRSNGSQTPYTCQVEDRGVDAHGDTLARATAVTVPSTHGGRLEVPGDVDVLSFTGVAEHFFNVRWSFTAKAAELRLKDTSGTVLTSAQVTRELSYRLPASGTYFLEVRSLDVNPPASIGDYTLTLEDRGVDDHGDTAETATPLPVGTAVEGRDQGVADVDAFSIQAKAGMFYRLTCTPGGGSGRCTVYLEGKTPRADPDPAHPQAFLFDAATPGTLTLTVHAPDAYSLLLEEVGLDDHGETLAESTPLTLGMPVDGTLESVLDEDSFVLSLEAGRTYRVQLDAAFALALRVEEVSFLSTLRFGGGEFTPQASGKVRFIVSPQSVSNPPLGPYQLRVDAKQVSPFPRGPHHDSADNNGVTCTKSNDPCR